MSAIQVLPEDLIKLSGLLLAAADLEQWSEVSRLQQLVHFSLTANNALETYDRLTLVKVKSAIEQAQALAEGRRHEIECLVKVLSK